MSHLVTVTVGDFLDEAGIHDLANVICRLNLARTPVEARNTRKLQTPELIARHIREVAANGKPLVFHKIVDGTDLEFSRVCSLMKLDVVTFHRADPERPTEAEIDFDLPSTGEPNRSVHLKRSFPALRDGTPCLTKRDILDQVDSGVPPETILDVILNADRRLIRPVTVEAPEAEVKPIAALSMGM